MDIGSLLIGLVVGGTAGVLIMAAIASGGDRATNFRS